MCILCVVQKWSRRVATMLPWLLFPLLGLWVFSHLLPPGFRFEFTSPRIACVLVLLVTIFWYEVLMPQLSAWRARNSAKYREMRRKEAIEMLELRKIATRLCRNCLTPYRDQNPAGGKFMCSYCGHVSKRPVLDIPGSMGGDGGGDGKKKECLGISCIFGGGGSVTKLGCRVRKIGSDTGSGDDHCFASKVFGPANRTFLRFRRFWRSIFGLTLDDDSSSDGDHEDMMFKEGENGGSFHESKGEKARRKAEEKRQARLERELLEEEERKQREEVAKLVEEQRRLRDEKMEADKQCLKSLISERESYSKRDADRKRQDRRKEKDKGSSKSNSDCEDFERKTANASLKRSESERRDPQKTANVSVKTRNSDVAQVSKASSNSHNSNRGNGTKYLDRVKGSFMSSSKAFSGASFFGKGTNASTSVTSKPGNHMGYVDHVQTATNKRDIHSTEHVRAKLIGNGDDKFSNTISYQHVASETQPRTAPKKSWRQLFTRSPAVPLYSVENFTSGSNQNFQCIAESSGLPRQASPSHPLADQISFGLPLPFSLSPFPNGSTGSNPVSSSVTEPIYPHVGEPPHDFTSEELDVFEGPCYVPDPVSLLGPVSESLDNFSLDLGDRFMKDSNLERLHGLKSVYPSVEAGKPSPIEAPGSRLRFVEERHTNYSSYPSSPKTNIVNASPFSGSTNEDEDGSWKMWSTPPLGHDGFGLIGCNASWLLPPGKNTARQEELLHPLSHKTVMLHFPMDNGVRSSTTSPQRHQVANSQNGGTFSPLGPGSNDNDPWMQRSAFQPLSGERQDHFPTLNPVTFCGSSNSSSMYSSELSPVSRWPKKDCAVNGSGEGDGNPSMARPHVGGLFSTPDVQSLWSYN